jgi:integrase
MPRQPEVHFRLKPVTKSGKSKGKASIYLQFVYNGNRLFYSFGQSIKPEDWNPAKERVKKKGTTTADGKFALNDLLDNLKNVCEKTYNTSLKNGIPAPATLAEALNDFINQNNNDDDQETLFALAERFINGEIKSKGKEKSKGTIQNYRAVVKHLKEFEAKTKYKIKFETINLDFFYKYTTYLKKVLNLAVNTIAKDIAIIKVFMGEAVDLGYTSNMQFRHSKFSFSEEETDQVYLTEKELHELYKFQIENKKLDQVKDLFIFGAWVGLRFSDFSNIKPENIVQIDGEYFIKTITQKTKELVIIPTNPVIIEIFKKYHQNANKLPKTLSNQKFNDYIKEVCKLAGLTETGRLTSKPHVMLWEVISSHTARRSFATNYYLQGFPTIDLMKITGHKTEKAFLKYIRVSKLDTAKRLNEHIKNNWSRSILRVAV